MENTIKIIEKELLLKAVEKGVNVICTHRGFRNYIDFSSGEIELLNDLANRIYTNDLVIVIDDKAFTPFRSDYNGNQELVGIKINTIIL